MAGRGALVPLLLVGRGSAGVLLDHRQEIGDERQARSGGKPPQVARHGADVLGFIVESPAKAKTIEKYLGKDYRVLASYGHIRDLPPKDGSVQPDDGFAMEWETYPDKAKQLKAITDEAKKADRLILATDPDREGEAISWHLQEVLAKKKALPKDTTVERVTFNAITKDGGDSPRWRNPRQLDTDLVDAYLARRALDYLVGFTPLAGAVAQAARCQIRGPRPVGGAAPDRASASARSSCSRRRNTGRVVAHLEHDRHRFDARLYAVRRQEARPARRSAPKAWRCAPRRRSNRAASASRASRPSRRCATRRRPSPPRPCSRRRRASSASPPATRCRIAQRALRGRRDHLHANRRRADGRRRHRRRAQGDRQDRYSGAATCPDKPRQYQTKAKNAQEAHEAIRPTDVQQGSMRRQARGDQARSTS
jgi:DNA topoisomerase-1